jgi:hypothetical protein
MSARRPDAGVAVAGLFSNPTATGGLAGRGVRVPDVHASDATARARERAVRLGVELSDAQITFLRGLSRPSRTGGQRTLGAKFVAAGVLSAAIELLEHGAIDMHGVTAGDHAEMTARARDALLRAGTTQQTNEEIR